VFAENVPNGGGGAVAVIGDCTNHHRYPVGGVPLVGCLLVGDTFNLARGTLDRPLDVLLGQVRRPRSLQRLRQAGIVFWIGIPTACL